MLCNPKVVVCDLDETLGYFIEFGIFWDSLKEYVNKNNIDCNINQDLFNKILDLFPEFLRPNIINILQYLKKKKLTNKCSKIMIYTNNQAPKFWAQNIIKYFENKVDYKIFDQIISAFKIKGQVVELCRTTHLKTHNDFIKCTKMPPNTEICFLDDVFYPDMKNEKIYYINLKPYIYDIELDKMIERFLKSNICIINDKKLCREEILKNSEKYNYIYREKTNIEYNIDKIISKKILNHLNTFFNITSIEYSSEDIKHQSKKNITKNKINKKYSNNKNKTVKRNTI